jgi:hypothetical protein
MLIEAGCHPGSDPHKRHADPSCHALVFHSLNYNSYNNNYQGNDDGTRMAGMWSRQGWCSPSGRASGAITPQPMAVLVPAAGGNLVLQARAYTKLPAE